MTLAAPEEANPRKQGAETLPPLTDEQIDTLVIQSSLPFASYGAGYWDVDGLISKVDMRAFARAAIAASGSAPVAEEPQALTDEEIISAIDESGLVCPDVGLALALVRIGAALAASPGAAPQVTEAPSQPDMIAVCAALGFDPTNHHNAAKCPYCRPAPSLGAGTEATAQPAELVQRNEHWRGDRIIGAFLPDLRALTEKLIDSALDSDASGRPEGSLADYALELRHRLASLPEATAQPALSDEQVMAALRAWYVHPYPVGDNVKRDMADMRNAIDAALATPEARTQAPAPPSDADARDGARRPTIYLTQDQIRAAEAWTEPDELVYTAVQMILQSSPKLHHSPEDDDRSAVTFWLPKSKERREALAQTFERMAQQVRHARRETGLD